MPASTLLRRPAFVLALGLCGVAAVTTLLGRLASGPQTQTKPVALSNVEGSAAYPALSADGNRLAYSERGLGKDDAYHIYVRRLPRGAVTQLTTGGMDDVSPAWPPDGAHIAFLRVSEGKARLIEIPSEGGPEKQIAEFAAAAVDSAQALPELAWSRDGRTLAVVTGGNQQPASIALIAESGGSPRQITTPPAGSDGDWSPAFSPDGAKLAFVRGASADSQDLYVADANGANPRRLTFDGSGIRGIAWAANGSELIYSASRSSRIRLWRIPAGGGSPREVIGTGDEARFPAASISGNRLAYTQSPIVTSVWRAELGKADSARPLLRSAGRERLASYSPDGKRIADICDPTGADEICVTDADGGNRVQATNFAAAPEHPALGRPAWSPDGKWLLFDETSQRGQEVWKTAAQAGAKPERVLEGAYGASWSHDGKSIYYSAQGAIWKAAADGSNPRQLTGERGGGAPVESPDGKFVYFRMRGASVWRVPSNGGTAEAAIEAEGPVIGDPVATKDGIYYVGFERFERSLAVLRYDFATKKTTDVFRFPMAGLRNFGYTPVFSISPDGKYILFARVDQAVTNLMLVDNFK